MKQVQYRGKLECYRGSAVGETRSLLTEVELFEQAAVISVIPMSYCHYDAFDQMMVQLCISNIDRRRHKNKNSRASRVYVCVCV